MKYIRYEFTTAHQFSVPVKNHTIALRCMPFATPRQRILASTVRVTPAVPTNYAVDGFGNSLLTLSLRDEHTQFFYRSIGRVAVDRTRQTGETAHPMYRHAGILTQPDNAVARFAQEQNSTDPEQLAAAVTAHFTYTPNSTNVATTVGQSFAQAKGVCQDYAHLLVTLCRLKGLPARYCMGITEGTGVTHAWAEVFVNGEWLGLDPTRDCHVDDSYLCFAVGRDAQDCPVERGNFYGFAAQTQTIFAVVQQE